MTSKNINYLTVIASAFVMLALMTSAVVAETIYCDNCSDCTTKIQNASAGDIVLLTTDLYDCDSTCITFDQPGGVIFDGMGYTIGGTGATGTNGVMLPAYTDGCTIQNMTLTGFDNGMYLYEASYNLIQNITAYNNDDNGIDIIYGTGNEILNCQLPENGYFDFYFRPHPITDCNMSLINVTGTNDLPIGYYTENVTISDTEFAVLYLCDADGSTLTNITITGSDSHYSNGMKMYGTDYATLTNITSSDNFCGLSIEESTNNIITNVTCDDCWHYNIYMSYGGDNWLENITTTNSHQAGIYLNQADYNTLTGITADNNPFGIKLDRCTNVVVNNSIITNNTLAGLSLAGTGSYDNLIYNNYFDNDNNVNTASTLYNVWNVTNRTGPNIFGGAFIGGNYWNDYSGWYTRPDGFGDEPHVLDANNTDFLPLVIDGEPEMWIRNGGYVLEVGEVWEYMVTCRNGSNIDVNCTNLTWYSSNEMVGTLEPTVDGANFTALSVGHTNVTVYGHGGLSDTVLQNVTADMICGDNDCDGLITINDAVETYYRAVDPYYLLGNEWAADTDGDGSITINDVVETYFAVVDPSYSLNCRE